MKTATTWFLYGMDTYPDFTHKSCFAPKRWVHKKRYRDAIGLLALTPTDNLLDYGCGDGYLMLLAARIIQPENIFGYEPSPSICALARNFLGDKFNIVRDFDAICDRRFKKIACLETLEHLPQDRREEALHNLEKALAPQGALLVSVPVEIGLPALVKNTFRILWGNTDNITLGNYFRGALGLPCKMAKPALLDGMEYIFAHTCFDYREFRRELAEHFLIAGTIFSPFAMLGKIANHSIFYICKLRRHDSC